jgi:hypothetical protein
VVSATRAKLRVATEGGRYETRGLGQQADQSVASELREFSDIAEQYAL